MDLSSNDGFVPVRRRRRQPKKKLMKSPYDEAEKEGREGDGIVLDPVDTSMELCSAPLLDTTMVEEGGEVEDHDNSISSQNNNNNNDDDKSGNMYDTSQFVPLTYMEQQQQKEVSFPSSSSSSDFSADSSSSSSCSTVEGEKKTSDAKKSTKFEFRRLFVPPHRFTPLRDKWMELLQPLIEHMKLQVRMNTRRRCVDIRTSPHTADISSLQKGSEFVKAFLLGFEIQDAIALLRLEDLFIQSFEVKDVKTLKGDHLGRCIGRISGKEGKTKYAIENATRTRIVLADSRIHILGCFHNIKLARDAVCSLILGKPPGKVYNYLRTVAKRLKERS